ncbi:hypothetical protein T439DRAFT_359969 [Meredithblackwellia eburnea MCA 4105]
MNSTTEHAAATMVLTPAEFNGPTLVGILVFYGLYGIALSQAWDYFEWYSDDSWIIKFLVAWEMLFAGLHVVFMGKVMWIKAIKTWGDAGALSNRGVFENMLNLTTVAIVVPSQMFFASVAYRAIGRNNYFLGIIGIGILLVLASGLAVCYQLFITGLCWLELNPTLPNVFLWTMAGVDLLTTGVLCFRFKTLQRHARDQSQALLSKLFFLSLRTGTMTTTVVLIERIFDLTNNGLLGYAPRIILSGIVVCSLLHTLNRRKQFQLMIQSSSHGGNNGGGLSKGLSAVAASGRQGGRADSLSHIRIDTIVLREMDDGTKSTQFHGTYTTDSAADGPFNSLSCAEEGKRVTAPATIEV